MLSISEDNKSHITKSIPQRNIDHHTQEAKIEREIKR